MNKQTLFVTLSAAVLVCGCQSSKVKISGRFVGSDAKNVYLEDASPLTQAVIDSAVLAGDGSYRFELKGVPKTPSCITSSTTASGFRCSSPGATV